MNTMGPQPRGKYCGCVSCALFTVPSRLDVHVLVRSDDEDLEVRDGADEADGSSRDSDTGLVETGGRQRPSTSLHARRHTGHRLDKMFRKKGSSVRITRFGRTRTMGGQNPGKRTTLSIEPGAEYATWQVDAEIKHPRHVIVLHAAGHCCKGCRSKGQSVIATR